MQEYQKFEYKPAKMCLLSIISLLVSILGFITWAFLIMGANIVAYILFIVLAVSSLIMPIVAKHIRKKGNMRGKGFEIAALVIGGFDFYFLIFTATRWNVWIGIAAIVIACVVYAKTSNNIE